MVGSYGYDLGTALSNNSDVYIFHQVKCQLSVLETKEGVGEILFLWGAALNVIILFIYFTTVCHISAISTHGSKKNKNKKHGHEYILLNVSGKSTVEVRREGKFFFVLRSI